MMVGTVLALCAVILLGAVSALLVGVVGGPIKVETPMVLTVMHGIAFVILATSWPRDAFFTYLGLLVACLAAQLVAAADLFRDEKRLPDWLARGWLGAAHLGMGVLIMIG